MSGGNKIPKGWVETTLGEVAKTNLYSINKSFAYKTILYLDTGSITKGKIDTLQHYDLKDAPSRAKRLVNKNDIVYSTVRPNLEHYGFISYPKENMVVSTGFTVITAEDINPKFLYYFLTQQNITEYLHSIAEQSVSTYPSIKAEDLETIEFVAPIFLPEQQAIASILTTFDDKIELLQAQNETLETIAQTIFKEWFGKYQVGDELPEGWRVGKLGEELNTSLGGTPARKKPEYWENGNIPWINSGAVNNFRIIEGTEFITKEGLEKSATKLLPKGTVILAITGATLGQYSKLEIDCCFNQSVVGITESDIIHSSYIYFWIANNIHEIIRSATGGAQQHINKGNVDSSNIIIPKNDILNEFYQVADPIMNKIAENLFQIQTLQQTRDTLLPKLMSGRLRVEEFRD